MQEIFTYQFSFNELAISRSQLEKIMGYEPGAMPEPFPEIVDEMLSVAAEYCHIQVGFSIVGDIGFTKETQSISVSNITFDVQSTIFSHIKRAGKIALFVCTAGPGIGTWAKQFMADGDLIKGYVADVIGSEVAEAAMDLAQGILANLMAASGLKISNRYSPGYCGWDVAEQHKLFSLLPENFCGVTLSDTALMHPIKSVSGIIGIGEDMRYSPYTCKICNSQNCIYRNRKS